VSAGRLGEYLKLKIPYGHHLVYGVIIIIVTLFMAKGIMGVVKSRTRNLKKREVEQ